MRVPKADRLEPPWPRLTKYDDSVALSVPEQRSGHHSAPGFIEQTAARVGGESPGNGVPGIPKLRPSFRRVDLPMGGGFGSIPTQPEATYDGVRVNDDEG